jgi:hypothetical protein
MAYIIQLDIVLEKKLDKLKKKDKPLYQRVMSIAVKNSPFSAG